MAPSFAEPPRSTVPAAPIIAKNPIAIKIVFFISSLPIYQFRLIPIWIFVFQVFLYFPQKQSPVCSLVHPSVTCWAKRDNVFLDSQPALAPGYKMCVWLSWCAAYNALAVIPQKHFRLCTFWNRQFFCPFSHPTPPLTSSTPWASWFQSQLVYTPAPPAQ